MRALAKSNPWLVRSAELAGLTAALQAPVIAARERHPTNGNNIFGMACQREKGTSQDPATSRPMLLVGRWPPSPQAAMLARGPQCWPGDTPEPPMARNPAIGGRRRRISISAEGMTPTGVRPAVIRRCLRLVILALVAGTAGLLALPAAATTTVSASPGSPAGSAAAARNDVARDRPWIAIMSMTPGYETTNGKVTISGIVTNPTGSPLRGYSIDLYSSPNPLTSQGMASYLTAPEPTTVDEAILGAVHNLSAPVPAHGTEQWSMTLATNQVGMHSFGVYPLAAHLIGSGPVPGTLGTPVDYARTFLPFWPGKSKSKTAPQVHPVSIAWVWPLIDTPQQTVCRTLTSNGLAGSVASGGRLNSLLAAGQSPDGQQAMLTWAIDPALLSDVAVMSRPYRVTGTHSCSGGKKEPPSSAARAWLANVQKAAAQQDFFTTPYADVDMAALAHSGLDTELLAAFKDGNLVSKQTTVPGTPTKVLGQPQRVTPATVGPIALPAAGIADYGLLERLAGDGIRTVVMSSSLIHTPATVTTVPGGQGSELTVLRADSTLTNILAARRDQIPGLVPDGYATPAGAKAQVRQAAAFAKEQWFLAETAMTAASAPAVGRSIVVAPPRRWDPPPDMADALLDDTVHTPWLAPASLASLASAQSRTGQINAKLPPEKRVSRGELSRSLLRQIKRLSGEIRLLDSILTTSGPRYLSTALDTVESSAWRGRKADERPALQLLHQDLAYINGQLRQVKIVGSPRITLGGQNGVVPVSISNGLSQAVTVKLVATAPIADHLTMGKSSNRFTQVVTVQKHSQRTIKIPVTAVQAGSTTLTVQLTTTSGRPLPVTPLSMTVAATHFGTLAIVIITIALVVFVLTATARAIRRGGPQDGGSTAEADELDPMPSTRDPASAADEPDSVVPRGADDRQPAKEADEHATPGTADRS